MILENGVKILVSFSYQEYPDVELFSNYSHYIFCEEIQNGWFLQTNLLKC